MHPLSSIAVPFYGEADLEPTEDPFEDFPALQKRLPLPTEIAMKIFSHLSWEEQAASSLTCKAWHQLFKDNPESEHIASMVHLTQQKMKRQALPFKSSQVLVCQHESSLLFFDRERPNAFALLDSQLEKPIFFQLEHALSREERIDPLFSVQRGSHAAFLSSRLLITASTVGTLALWHFDGRRVTKRAHRQLLAKGEHSLASFHPHIYPLVDHLIVSQGKLYFEGFQPRQTFRSASWINLNLQGPIQPIEASGMPQKGELLQKGSNENSLFNVGYLRNASAIFVQASTFSGNQIGCQFTKKIFWIPTNGLEIRKSIVSAANKRWVLLSSYAHLDAKDKQPELEQLFFKVLKAESGEVQLDLAKDLPWKEQLQNTGKMPARAWLANHFLFVSANDQLEIWHIPSRRTVVHLPFPVGKEKGRKRFIVSIALEKDQLVIWSKEGTQNMLVRSKVALHPKAEPRERAMSRTGRLSLKMKNLIFD
ncbi:MAG: F-box-like [Chlamydiales bacterium]|jgi:hypothetical protein|nr:F-box-like [Chlamydiales bacterium]